jgi:uncharacterized protein YfaT (DUF1175 family)
MVEGLSPNQMEGRSFLMPPEDNGTRKHTKIIQMINKYKDRMESHPKRIKFKCLVNDEYEEVIAYNDIIDYIKHDDVWDGVWKFKQILDHQGPIKANDEHYRGAQYNILVKWETGKRMWEPLV